jgi:hypothetical protein
MPQVGFEPTIPAFERAKAVHALDRATTVIGNEDYCPSKISASALDWILYENGRCTPAPEDRVLEMGFMKHLRRHIICIGLLGWAYLGPISFMICNVVLY